MQIEKNIPVTPHGNNGHSRTYESKYPFARMEIGDSFLAEPSVKEQTFSVAVARANRLNKSAGKRFITRQTPDGRRCWRIA